MKSQSLWSSTPAWRLPICKAPSPTSAWRLSIYKGALTSPCARQFIIPTRGSVCPPSFKELQFSSPTWRFQRNVACSHLATRDDQLPHQDRRRALCVPFGTTQVEFSFDMQVLLPALLPIDRAPARAPKFQMTTTRKPDDDARRYFARTSSTADMFPCSLLLRDFSTLVIETYTSSLLAKKTFIGYAKSDELL